MPPRFFFMAEDQLDELERLIDKLPGGETKVAYKMLEQVKGTQQLSPKLMEALLKGPPPGEEREPPKGPPSSVGKPDADPPSAAQVAKGANAVAATPPPAKD